MARPGRSKNYETKLDGNRPIKGRAIKRYSPKEVAEHLRIIQDAWIEGASDAEIRRILDAAGHKVGGTRVAVLRGRIEQRIAEETESSRPYSKVRQARRITRAIRDTKGQRAKDGKGWIVKPDHAARIGYENMIAKIEGNYEPLRVEVDAVHRHAVAEVIASFTEEQMDRYVQAFDRMASLAESKARETGEHLADLLPRPPVAALQPGHRASTNGKSNGIIS